MVQLIALTTEGGGSGLSATGEVVAIVIAALLLFCLILLIARPETADALLSRLKKVSVTGKGLELEFFNRQAEKAAEERGGEAPAAPAGTDLSGVTILWVDDRPDGNFTEASMFAALGAEVKFALNTREAIILARELSPALMISDISRGGDAQAGLAMPAEFEAASVALPSLIYYVGTKMADTTEDGRAVTTQPDELFQAAFAALKVA